MADMGIYLTFDVDHISMIPTGGELVACKHSVKVDDEDLAGAYEIIRKLYQEVKVERDNLKRENVKLREIVAHLMYVKPKDVDAILYKGKVLRFDDLLAEVGMRWEWESEYSN